MVKKAQIEIEQFDNGITARWEDGNDIVEPTKSLAPNGNEAECIGREIWGDVHEILATEATDKVIIKIQYVIPD